MRVDKLLSSMGIGTRKEIKMAIKRQEVVVNGSIVKDPGLHVEETRDEIYYQGKEIRYQAFHYYLLNKPQGYVTATKDPSQKTVMDLLNVPKKETLFPVGRLDKDTEGLLLITDDGQMAHQLLSPKYHVPKVYYARLDFPMKIEDQRAFLEGLDIGDEKKTQPAFLEILPYGENKEVLITITEGRFHQVKRMCQARGATVLFLRRIKMGNLNLPKDLAVGEYKELKKEDIDGLWRGRLGQELGGDNARRN